MKKRTRKLWQALNHQMTLTLEALEILKAAYAHGTAEDQQPTGDIQKPDIHDPVKPVEPSEHLRSYR